MTRAIDHLVVATDRLAVSAARLEMLGFHVAAQVSHPFGTANRCVFFENRTYFEPLAVEDRQTVEAAAREGSIFLRRSEAYRFRRGEGAPMLAFRTTDARADAERFCQAGYSDGSTFSFSRSAGAGPDSQVVSFVLAFAADPRAPDITFFTVEHHGTDPLFTGLQVRHPNGALGIVEIAISEPNPSDFQYFLECASGGRDLRATSIGIEAELSNGVVRILTPDGSEMVYGALPPACGRGAVLRAATVSVRELDRVSAILSANEVPVAKVGERLVVAPAKGLAIHLAFEQAS